MSNVVAVIGAGSWGTALASLLARGNRTVRLHCYPAEIAIGIQQTRHNPLYFPEVELSGNIQATAELAEALDSVSIAFLVIPSKFIREFFTKHIETWQTWATEGRVLCNCTKGLLLSPTERTGDWLASQLPEVAICHLSGPNFAKELIASKPAAAAVAGPLWAAESVQAQLMSDIYRIYTASDEVGVEVAGFYKNVIAIAAGALHEMGLGQNARAVLITRALAEMGRLVDYFGGQPETLIGLAGVGDLTLTCSSELSRNFQVGIRRARGQSLVQIQEEMMQVAEGIQASAAVHHWPEEHGLTGWPELPIAAEVYGFLHQDADPLEAIQRLMRRPPKAE